MSKLFYPDFFNDVFGPIMQPGSSGGFAGPCRIGNVAAALVDGQPKKVRFLFNKGTDISQLVNFMSDRGYLGGVQGFNTEDIRLFDAHTLAREKGISYEFSHLEEHNGYEGSVQIEITGKNGETSVLIASSVGGGMIKTWSINGFKIQWQADTFGILVADKHNIITKVQISEFESLYKNQHIDTFPVVSLDGTQGYFIELSVNPDKKTIEQYFNNAVVYVLPALLPVVTSKNKRPQLFKTIEEWRQLAEERNISFVQAAIEYEKASSGWSDQEIWDYFERIAGILNEQIHSLEKVGYENAVDTKLLPIYGKLWNRYIKKGKKISDTLTNHILIHGFSTNAKLPGVKIVPGPMGTGGGYLFSALDAVREERGYSHQKLIEALIVAAALGALAFTHTNASGEVGCVGESGVCCAMASGAIAWLAGGDGKQVENAASMALQANMGIPCDPIAGGLEFPCITRTLRAAVTAPLYADLALSGIDPLIPYHELLQAIEYNFRRSDKKLLCGQESGCNCTPTAKLCHQRLEQDSIESLYFSAN